MEEWCQSEKESKQIINCFVQFLAEDVYWTKQCISQVDKETLIVLAKRLES